MKKSKQIKITFPASDGKPTGSMLSSSIDSFIYLRNMIIKDMSYHLKNGATKGSFKMGR